MIKTMINWKSVVFSLAVCLLFVPMVFLGVNTLFPELPENTCYDRYDRAVPIPVGKPQYEMTESELLEEQLRQEETRTCYAQWQVERRKAEASRYVGIMLISLFASLALLLPLETSVTYGLFLGVVITAFTGTVRYIDSRSLIGFVLLITLFIVVIAFIQRQKK